MPWHNVTISNGTDYTIMDFLSSLGDGFNYLCDQILKK